MNTTGATNYYQRGKVIEKTLGYTVQDRIVRYALRDMQNALRIKQRRAQRKVSSSEHATNKLGYIVHNRYEKAIQTDDINIVYYFMG